jgi:hypothetical protein
MEQVASTTKIGAFYVSSSSLQQTVSVITPSASFQISKLDALELAAALIAHAERADHTNVSLAATQRELGRAATKSRSVPFFERGHILGDVLLVLGAAFAMPVLLHYGFELLIGLAS